ncbi:MAG: sulfite exporter TauE/SafE family protein [Candidatus Eisenbacteria bacterium]
MEIWQVPALLAGGFFCGVINALAGGGSFVTLPLLLWIGLPPQVANATNRVAIALQCVTGIVAYDRRKMLPWSHLPAIAVPAVAGSLLGAYLAAHVDETMFRHASAVLFAVMAGTVFLDPGRWARKDSVGRIRPHFYPLFFVMGIYGGFLQAGLGVLLISTFVLLGGYDVVRGNALKFALVLTFTTAALLLFASVGQVRWLIGLCLACGSMAGGFVGARLVMAKGSPWVRGFVVVAALAAIAELLLGA